MKRSRAFTLIELLVVVAIITTLIAILLPALGKARTTAKLVVCGTQQRSIVAAVTVYASGNRDAYPASIQGTNYGWWTLPNRLNYHSAANTIGGATDGRDGGYMAKLLYNYLPTVDIFYCPLTGEIPTNAEEGYRTGEAYILNGSYFMLWGYHGYDTQAPNFFDGPDATAEARTDQVLTADMLAYNEPGGSTDWISSHPGGGAGQIVNSSISEYRWNDPTGTTPTGILMNAGYVDGHVSQYLSEDTVWYRPGVNGSHPSKHFLPEGQ